MRRADAMTTSGEYVGFAPNWPGLRPAAAAASGWLHGQFIADVSRQALWAPVFLGAGILVYFAAPIEPPLWAALWPGAALAAWLSSLRQDQPVLSFAAAILFWLSLGFAAGIVRTASLATPVLAVESAAASVKGRVEDTIPLSGGAARIVLQVMELKGRPASFRARITLRRPGGVEAGDWIEVLAGLKSPPAPVAPGAFDFGRHLWFQGVGATGFALGAPRPIQPLRPLTAAETARDALARLRDEMSRRIMIAMPGPNGPIAAALITGERSAIDDATLAAYRDSSLAHLLSISGLHMVLAGFGVFGAIRIALVLTPGVGLRAPAKKIAAAGALIASFAYLLLSGAATPSLRAFIMIALVFAAMMCDRPGLTLRPVALAALLILIATPESVLDVSFQMSFAAVVALVAAFEWWNERAQDPGFGGWMDSLWRWFSGAAATSAIAGLATTPFAAFHFQRVADYGVAANLLALPVVGLIVMPAAVLTILAMPFGLEAWPLAAMELGLQWVTATAYEVASWPGAAHTIPAMPGLALALFVCGGLWLCLWRRPWRLGGAVVILCGIAALSIPPERPDILAAADGKTFAVRRADGTLGVPTLARGAFDMESWLRAEGEARALAEVKAGSRSEISCDKDTCQAEGPAGRIIFLRQKTVVACHEARVLIDPIGGAKTCAQDALVLTPEFLAASQGATLTLRDGRWEIVTVAQRRGQRPWTQSAQKADPVSSAASDR
jgi:competence protein ComEC